MVLDILNSDIMTLIKILAANIINIFERFRLFQNCIVLAEKKKNFLNYYFLFVTFVIIMHVIIIYKLFVSPLSFVMIKIDGLFMSIYFKFIQNKNDKRLQVQKTHSKFDK